MARRNRERMNTNPDAVSTSSYPSCSREMYEDFQVVLQICLPYTHHHPSILEDMHTHYDAPILVSYRDVLVCGLCVACVLGDAVAIVYKLAV